MALSVGIQELESSALLGSAVLSGLEEWRAQGRLDPWSLKLVKELGRQCRTIGAVMAWTKLRHVDSKKLTRDDVFRSSSFDVSIQKTGAVRTIDPIRPDGNESLFDRVPDSARVDVCSYGQLNRQVHRARARIGLEIPGISKDGTHTWRHLHASWMYENGHTVSEIRDFFGHAENSVTQQYIHESIDFSL